ncbi:hypothetical protein DFH08DRAFT_824774 [Mycena albidolilacea]|uniref:Uncharacterized protein n=1 Tax=Mycena albidolilacea TaxID=1033008 RepID=A0AAD7EA56_9AGAR|nr:hypothetical protein DFH08DRAFT_824774 [Mycena albidolilacea]
MRGGQVATLWAGVRTQQENRGELPIALVGASSLPGPHLPQLWRQRGNTIVNTAAGSPALLLPMWSRPQAFHGSESTSRSSSQSQLNRLFTADAGKRRCVRVSAGLSSSLPRVRGREPHDKQNLDVAKNESCLRTNTCMKFDVSRLQRTMCGTCFVNPTASAMLKPEIIIAIAVENSCAFTRIGPPNPYRSMYSDPTSHGLKDLPSSSFVTPI